MIGEMVERGSLTQSDIERMYALMAEFYAQTEEHVFRRDLAEKEYVLLLREGGKIVGFTTQKLLDVQVGDEVVHGIFSGDTIIDKAHWGEAELFRVWAQFWFSYAEQFPEFWWFLICKGYKTYRILPTFWETFYPTYRQETPPREQAIMDSYASALYGEEYDRARGVIRYRHTKDRLREGVADIDEHRLKNRDIAYFAEHNPGHVRGDDLVCLAKISRDAMKPRSPKVLGI